MQPLAPIPVTSVDFDVALVPDGISAAVTPGWVRAANESNFALQCSLGADTHWLQPWSVDVWPVHAVTSMHVHPVALVTPLPVATWSTLLVTVAQPYETIPGTYPASLDRLSSVYSQRQALIDTSGFSSLQNKGLYTISDLTDRTFTFVIPPGTQSIRLDAFTGNVGAQWTNFHLTGDVSGKTYVSIDNQSFPASGFEQNSTFRPLACDTVLSLRLTLTAAVAIVFVLSAALVTEDLIAELGGTVGVADNQPIVVRTSSSAAPAYWQSSPNVKLISAAPGAGLAVALGIGVAGKLITPHDFFLSSDFAGAGNNFIELRNATTHVAFCGGVRTGPGEISRGDLKGATSVGLGTGDDVEVFNGSGGGANVIGHFAYNLK